MGIATSDRFIQKVVLAGVVTVTFAVYGKLASPPVMFREIGSVSFSWSWFGAVGIWASIVYLVRTVKVPVACPVWPVSSSTVMLCVPLAAGGTWKVVSMVIPAAVPVAIWVVSKSMVYVLFAMVVLAAMWIVSPT